MYSTQVCQTETLDWNLMAHVQITLFIVKFILTYKVDNKMAIGGLMSKNVQQEVSVLGDREGPKMTERLLVSELEWPMLVIYGREFAWCAR